MPTDYQLYELRHTIYSAIKSESDAAQAIADAHQLSYDSVRGRLSRANNPENQTKLIMTLANEVPDIAPSVERQIAVVTQSQYIWDTWQKSHSESTAMFISDLHLPYPRFDAYELAMQIVNDLNPNIISGANDLRDNTGYGRWGDDRPIRGQLHSSDVANINRLELAHYRNLSRHGRLIVQVMGNHDRWYYNNLRETQPLTAEKQIADYMENLYDAGMLQFSRGYDENYLALGNGLIWWHGQYVNKSPQTLAKQNIEQFLHVFNDGTIRSVVCGHTHRPMSVEGAGIGYPSVKFVNSGALTDYAPYLNRHPQGHGLGVVYCEFQFGEWEHELHLIQFTKKGNKLRANFRGVTYEVKLNTQHKEEYL